MKVSDQKNNFKGYPIPDADISLTKELCDVIKTIEVELAEKGSHHILSDFFVSAKNGKQYAHKKIFDEYGECNSKATENRKENTEYMGLYIFSEKVGNDFEPIYVGISRKIIQRFRNHAFGKSADTSTLAYLMAFERNKDKQSKEHYNQNINKIADNYKAKVRNLFVYFYPYNYCTYKLQILEVLSACKFKTKWNSFKTH